MTYTVINSRDSISNTYENLNDALGMATRVYDGIGVKCSIFNDKNSPIAYTFTASGVAVTNLVNPFNGKTVGTKKGNLKNLR